MSVGNGNNVVMKIGFSSPGSNMAQSGHLRVACQMSANDPLEICISAGGRARA
jgi:hypothetical protein